MIETEKRPVYTWKELKEFCNSLTEEQLNQSLKVWVGDDESPTVVDCAEELGEIHYSFYDAEYSCTKNDFMKEMFVDEETDDFLYQTLDEALEKENYTETPADRVYLHAFL